MKFHRLITGLLVGQILGIAMLLLFQFGLFSRSTALALFQTSVWAISVALISTVLILLIAQQTWKNLDRSLFVFQLLLLLVVGLSVWFTTSLFSVVVLFGALLLSFVALNGYRRVYLRMSMMKRESVHVPVIASQHATHVHDPHCIVVDRIPKKDRKMFSNMNAALTQGYTPCKVCNVA